MVPENPFEAIIKQSLMVLSCSYDQLFEHGGNRGPSHLRISSAAKCAAIRIRAFKGPIVGAVQMTTGDRALLRKFLVEQTFVY